LLRFPFAERQGSSRAWSCSHRASALTLNCGGCIVDVARSKLLCEEKVTQLDGLVQFHDRLRATPDHDGRYAGTAIGRDKVSDH